MKPLALMDHLEKISGIREQVSKKGFLHLGTAVYLRELWRDRWREGIGKYQFIDTKNGRLRRYVSNVFDSLPGHKALHEAGDDHFKLTETAYARLLPKTIEDKDREIKKAENDRKEIEVDLSPAAKKDNCEKDNISKEQDSDLKTNEANVMSYYGPSDRSGGGSGRNGGDGGWNRQGYGYGYDQRSDSRNRDVSLHTPEIPATFASREEGQKWKDSISEDDWGEVWERLCRRNFNRPWGNMNKWPMLNYPSARDLPAGWVTEDLNFKTMELPADKTIQAVLINRYRDVSDVKTRAFVKRKRAERKQQSQGASMVSSTTQRRQVRSRGPPPATESSEGSGEESQPDKVVSPHMVADANNKRKKEHDEKLKNMEENFKEKELMFGSIPDFDTKKAIVKAIVSIALKLTSHAYLYMLLTANLLCSHSQAS